MLRPYNILCTRVQFNGFCFPGISRARIIVKTVPARVEINTHMCAVYIYIYIYCDAQHIISYI